jgi:hypothetical protein
MTGLERLGVIVFLVAVYLAVNAIRFAVGQNTRLTGVANFPKKIDRLFRRQDHHPHQS